MRRFLAILFVLPALGAAPALAADRVGIQANVWSSVSSAHFVVHFADGFDAARAQQVGVWADDAYVREVSVLGFPAPKEDDDGKVDIYIDDIADPAVSGYGHSDRDVTPAVSGWIELDNTLGVRDQSVVAHELFHVIQFGMILKQFGIASEATANWAASLVTGVTELTHWGDHSSLDCFGRSCGDEKGYSRWSFYRFVTDRYGVGIVREMWMQPTDDPTAALDVVLAKRGTSVQREFVAFENATLDKRSPQFPYLEPKFGSAATMHLGLPYLASGQPSIEQPSTGEMCRAAVLHVTVTTAAPDISVAYVRTRGKPVVLALTNGSASFDLTDWRSCLAGNVWLIVSNGGLKSAGVDVTAAIVPREEPAPAVSVTPSSKPTSRNTGLNLAFVSSGFGAVDVTLIGYPATTRYQVFGDGMRRWFTFGRQLKAGRYVLLVTTISTAGDIGTRTRVSFVVTKP